MQRADQSAAQVPGAWRRATRCTVCREPFAGGHGSPRQKTRDHVVPICHGGAASFFGAGLGIVVYRAMCQRCNSLRAITFHCVAVAASVLAIAASTGEDPFRIVRRLRFYSERRPISAKRMRALIRAHGLTNQ